MEGVDREYIMKLNLKEAYGELMNIIDDLDEVIDRKYETEDMLEEYINWIKYGIPGLLGNYQVPIQLIINKEYIEIPQHLSVVVRMKKRVTIPYDVFHDDLFKRMSLIKNLLIEYYLKEDKPYYER